MGRRLQKPAICQAAIDAGHSSGAGPDLPAAAYHVSFGSTGQPDLPGNSDRGIRGDFRAGSAWDAVQYFGWRWFHCAVRSGGPERSRLGQCCRAPAAGGPLGQSGRRRNSTQSITPRADDRPRRQPGIPPNGDLPYGGCRNPAATRHGRDRWTDHVNTTDGTCRTFHLPLVRRQRERSGDGTTSPRPAGPLRREANLKYVPGIIVRNHRIRRHSDR